MSSSKPLSIPTPVGGVVNETDRVPSIVFVVAWALLLPFVVRRFVVPRRRTILLIGVCTLPVLNIVLFSIRAAQAFDAGQRTSTGLLIVMQSMLANGCVLLTTDCLPLLRAIIQNAKQQLQDPEVAGSQQADTRRKKYRPFVIALVVIYIALPGILAATQGGLFKKAVKDQTMADAVQGMRFLSAALAFSQIIVMAGFMTHGLLRLPRIDRSACLHLLAVLPLITIIIFYRFAAMANDISSLTYTGPGSLTSVSAKALFYVLHCLPEWVAAALLLIPDTRTAFGAKAIWPKKGRRQDSGVVSARQNTEPEVEYVEMSAADTSTPADKVKPIGR